MRDKAGEARRWHEEAGSDLAFARVGHREGFHSKVCFLCQQAGEKALKALAYADGERHVAGHSLQELLDERIARHPALASFQDLCRLLDQYYVPTRYPDALPGGVPHRSYTETQSREALDGCGRLLDAVRDELRQLQIRVE
jgi:HEPN domain-containing protein